MNRYWVGCSCNGECVLCDDNGMLGLFVSLKSIGQTADEGAKVYLDCDGQPAAKPSHIVLRSKRGGNYVKKVTR